MSIAYTELFTPGQLTEPDEGRALIQAISTNVPSWLPHRYGWSEPLRNVYDPERFDDFWKNIGLWRNATRDTNGSLKQRVGPWDLMTRVTVSGDWRSELSGNALGAYLADCGTKLDITYGIAHLFTPEEKRRYYDDWFASPEPDRVKRARQGTMPYFLRDLYWGNVFGPPYVDLFGAERLLSARVAVVRELRPGYIYLQLTDDIADRAGQEMIKEEVKAHLGADCFHEATASTPRRAPHFTTAAEDGLWKPSPDTSISEELQALLAKAPTDES